MPAACRVVYNRSMQSSRLVRRLMAVVLLAGLLGACQGAPVLPSSGLPTPVLPPSGRPLTRGPYLQDVSDSAATVVWRTSVATTGGLRIQPVDAPTAVKQIGETQAATD